MPSKGGKPPPAFVCLVQRGSPRFMPFLREQGEAHTHFYLKSCPKGIWDDPPVCPSSPWNLGPSASLMIPLTYFLPNHSSPGPHRSSPHQGSSLKLCGPHPPLGVGLVPRYSTYLLKFRVIDFPLIFSSFLSSNPFGKYLSRGFYSFWPHSAWNKVMGVSFPIKALHPSLSGSPGQGNTYKGLHHCAFVQLSSTFWTFAGHLAPYRAKRGMAPLLKPKSLPHSFIQEMTTEHPGWATHWRDGLRQTMFLVFRSLCSNLLRVSMSKNTEGAIVPACSIYAGWVGLENCYQRQGSQEGHLWGSDFWRKTWMNWP